MNERLKELVEQADEYARGQSILYDTWKKIYSKKFAELIVRECLSNMEDGDLDFAIWKTKKDFGVEE